MTRRALVPIVFACLTSACAASARKNRGPDVVLDRYLAPVSSAVFARVPSCQTGARCDEQPAKAAEPAVATAPTPDPVAPPAGDLPPADPPAPATPEPPLPSIAEAPARAPAPIEPPPETETPEPPLAPELLEARGL